MNYTRTHTLSELQIIFCLFAAAKGSILLTTRNGCWIPRQQTFCIWASQHLYKYTWGIPVPIFFNQGCTAPTQAHTARNNQAHMATQNTWVSHPNQGPHGLTQLAHTATQNTKHLGITPQLRPTWPQHHSHKQLGPAAKTVRITNKKIQGPAATHTGITRA